MEHLVNAGNNCRYNNNSQKLYLCKKGNIKWENRIDDLGNSKVQHIAENGAVKYISQCHK